MNVKPSVWTWAPCPNREDVRLWAPRPEDKGRGFNAPVIGLLWPDDPDAMEPPPAPTDNELERMLDNAYGYGARGVLPRLGAWQYSLPDGHPANGDAGEYLGGEADEWGLYAFRLVEWVDAPAPRGSRG